MHCLPLWIYVFFVSHSRRLEESQQALQSIFFILIYYLLLHSVLEWKTISAANSQRETCCWSHGARRLFTNENKEMPEEILADRTVNIRLLRTCPLRKIGATLSESKQEHGDDYSFSTTVWPGRTQEDQIWSLWLLRWFTSLQWPTQSGGITFTFLLGWEVEKEKKEYCSVSVLLWLKGG